MSCHFIVMGYGWEDLALLVFMLCSKVLCDRFSIN